MKRYCFGIDVGGTSVKMGFFRTDGELLEKWEIPTRTENGGSAILPDIAASILAKLAARGIEKSEVVGMGIGIPGPINAEGVVPHTANLGWGYKEVTRELSELANIPSKGANDANVAALGEMWKGAAAGHRSGVMVTLGTGVGGGIIVEGKILAGTNGAGGEIGHIHVDDRIPGVCGCGNHGCLEQVASANGIVKLARWMAQERGKVSASPNIDRLNSKLLWDAVKSGDPFACEVAERFGSYLGLALANIATTVDPEVFIIGGGMSKAGEIILDYVQKYYVRYTFKACRDARFVLAKLGNDAGIYGSAKLVIEG
ncbi:MAG: ROK family glucokinase [Lachnospiraceae bacterium]|nr:ROK family glucokinase [Lachnospiraceae bacterium]